MIKEFEKRVFSSLILIPFSFFLIIKGSILFNFFLIFCLLTALYEWYKLSKNKSYNLIGYIFLIFSFYSAYYFRNNFGDESLTLFLIIVIICISTDIGGYIFGNFFNGPKLTKISPKKTYSGVLGSYIFTLLFIYIFYYFSYLFPIEVEKPSLKILFLYLLISTISQIGDIIVSLFKRLAKVKDTGNIIPGHGGILDRLDGMIFAFPFSFIIFYIS